MILIKYGTEDNNINVTDICYSKLLKGDIITIPAGDQIRCIYFTDPIFGTIKKIFIIKDDIITDYAENDTIKINIRDLTITKESDDDIIQKLLNIHSKLQIKYGYFYEEYPEQMMAVKFLTGKEKVLEIGANIGRNSLIIASILEDSSNLVSMECDKEISNQLLDYDFFLIEPRIPRVMACIGFAYSFEWQAHVAGSLLSALSGPVSM